MPFLANIERCPRFLEYALIKIKSSSISIKKCWPGTAKLVILNEEMEDIMKVVKSLEVSCLLIKGSTQIYSQTIGYKTKQWKFGFLGILLDKLMRGCFCNVFVDFMLKGKSLAVLFFPNNKIMIK